MPIEIARYILVTPKDHLCSPLPSSAISLFDKQQTNLSLVFAVRLTLQPFIAMSPCLSRGLHYNLFDSILLIKIYSFVRINELQSTSQLTPYIHSKTFIFSISVILVKLYLTLITHLIW